MAKTFREPAANVAAVIGPGAITPDSEMPTFGDDSENEAGHVTTPVSIPVAVAYVSKSSLARWTTASILSAPRNEIMTIMILVVSNWTIVRSESLVVLPNGPS